MDTKENSLSRRRTVLYDRPAADDAFSGGGHKRTAVALANTIQDFDDQTRSIGLEGKWGSGKSTIIEIAKVVLDQSGGDRKYCVFSFDLWTNQNGNFRRAFLESLLSWLETVDKSKSSFIEHTRNRIRDRVVDTRSTNIKVFSPFGLIVLAFLLVLPWLYMWLSPAALAMKGNGAAGMTATAFVLAVLMIVITVIAIGKTYSAAKRRGSGEKLTLAAAASLTWACPRFCVNGPMAGNCRQAWRHDEQAQP
jgi:hypothetical protein